MDRDDEHAGSLEKLQHALEARSAMKAWAGGAELIELVRAAYTAGWLHQLHDETTAVELAAAHGVSIDQVANVLIGKGSVLGVAIERSP